MIFNQNRKKVLKNSKKTIKNANFSINLHFLLIYIAIY